MGLVAKPIFRHIKPIISINFFHFIYLIVFFLFFWVMCVIVVPLRQHPLPISVAFVLRVPHTTFFGAAEKQLRSM